MEKNVWTIPDLLQLSGGYWAACALHAGVKLDIFTALNGVTISADRVASACACEPRAIGMLLDALSSLGLIEKQPDGYRATNFSSQYLDKNSTGYLGHIIMHHHYLMPGWSVLHTAIQSGGQIRESVSHVDDAVERESFLMGMYNLASLLAPRIASAINLGCCRRLLDLGGGPGTYAIHFCQQNPGLSAVVYDLPSSRTFANNTVARYDLSERISFVAGNYHMDPVPGEFDVAWLSHILHSEGPEGCRTVLQKGVEALTPGGMLLVQEFILDETGAGSVFPALFSLNMLLCTASGRSYAEIELRVMMEEAGLIDIKRLAIDLPNGAGVMVGIRG